MALTWASTGSRSVKLTSTGNESAPATPAKAAQTVAFSAAEAGDTVTVAGIVFTAIANGGTPATPQEFAVGTGASADTDTGAAFVAAVAATSHLLGGMTAVNATGTVTLTAGSYGVAGNALTLAESTSGARITVGGATFASGVELQGLNLADVGSVAVKAEAATTGQTIAGGSLNCYVFNSRSGRYLRYPDGDLVPGTAAQGFAWSFAVTIPADRIFWIPVGVTVSSGNHVIYMDAFEADQRLSGSGRAL